MNETDTFNKLKRTPYYEVREKIDISNFKASIAPVYRLGSLVVESTKFYNRELSIHYWRIKTLEENGWTFEEFILEGERLAIIDQIAEFNHENKIPQEIIDRAKVFFPDAKFVHAHVELE